MAVLVPMSTDYYHTISFVGALCLIRKSGQKMNALFPRISQKRKNFRLSAVTGNQTHELPNVRPIHYTQYVL